MTESNAIKCPHRIKRIRTIEKSELSTEPPKEIISEEYMPCYGKDKCQSWDEKLYYRCRRLK